MGKNGWNIMGGQAPAWGVPHCGGGLVEDISAQTQPLILYVTQETANNNKMHSHTCLKPSVLFKFRNSQGIG